MCMNVLTSTNPSLTDPYWCLEVYWWQTVSSPAMQVATVFDELLFQFTALRNSVRVCFRAKPFFYFGGIIHLTNKSCFRLYLLSQAKRTRLADMLDDQPMQPPSSSVVCGLGLSRSFYVSRVFWRALVSLS